MKAIERGGQGWSGRAARRPRVVAARRPGRLSLVLVLILGLLGPGSCGDEESFKLPPAGGPRDGYPAGPYGTVEDAIVADLSFTRPDASTLTLGDVYADGANRLLLISSASGWCASCVEEQRDLQELHERYRAEGLFVLVALFEDSDYRPVGAAYAGDWVRQFDVTYAVAADEAFQLGAYYNRALTPLVMLVDVSTMQILRISSGWDAGAIEAILEAWL